MYTLTGSVRRATAPCRCCKEATRRESLYSSAADHVFQWTPMPLETVRHVRVRIFITKAAYVCACGALRRIPEALQT